MSMHDVSSFSCANTFVNDSWHGAYCAFIIILSKQKEEPKKQRTPSPKKKKTPPPPSSDSEVSD